MEYLFFKGLNGNLKPNEWMTYDHDVLTGCIRPRVEMMDDKMHSKVGRLRLWGDLLSQWLE